MCSLFCSEISIENKAEIFPNQTHYPINERGMRKLVCVIRWHFPMRSACTPNRHLPNCIFFAFQRFSAKSKNATNHKFAAFYLKIKYYLSGEWGIRTPGTVIPYVSLANWWFQPLTQLSKTGSFVKERCKYRTNLSKCKISGKKYLGPEPYAGRGTEIFLSFGRCGGYGSPAGNAVGPHGEVLAFREKTLSLRPIIKVVNFCDEKHT